MRFRPANISLINRRLYLHRLLLTLSSVGKDDQRILTGHYISNVHTGDYLLAVNGRQLYAADNLYSFFDGAAGKQTVITVGAKPDGSDARDVNVVPIPDEAGLRNLAWINHNIKLVDKLSDGKVAYVYMPNTAGAGYDNFNRYFYAQIGKQGLVLDERYNEGGSLAN
ncbi:MAG: PDZ domain-containing protein [Terracidiphilus sp.]